VLIAEIFRSRQGEGRLTGTPSVFVRFSGCNLRCWYCDTPYTSWDPEGEAIPLHEICRRLDAHDVAHVVITGGEPMLFPSLPELCAAIHHRGRHITIETAGTVDRDVACDLMSISPKLSNSTPTLEKAGHWRVRHEQTRHRPDIVSRLMNRYEYQLKFVVDEPADLDEIEQYLAELSSVDRDRVWLMPQGISVEELRQREIWLSDYCEQSGYRLCPRKHIEWYGHRRGT
jgi:7-carboxy-7-deazaguanine synthase